VVVRCSPEKAPDQFPINGRWLPAVAEAFNQREFIVDPRNNRWKKTMTNIVLPGVENKTIYKHYLLRSLMVLGISAAATTGLALAGAATGIVSSVLIFSVIKLLQLSARVRHYVHLNTNLS
jgi:hypothetical protein